jgi:antitoxin PrlF
MRVMSEGQVTIPQQVRERLGITRGSEVNFQLDDAGARLVRVSPGEGKTLVAKAPCPTSSNAKTCHGKRRFWPESASWTTAAVAA